MTSAEEQADFPHFTNALWYEDRVSPAAEMSIVNAPESEEKYRDTYFGNSWNWTPAAGAAVYGRTSALPLTPIDSRGTGEFLRVPFRRIPIIDLHSVEDVVALAHAVASKDPAVRGMWRGQANQHFLKRSGTDRLRLYGDESILEPSLRPSASREDIYFPDVFGTWSGLLDLYIEGREGRLSQIYGPHASGPLRDSKNFRCGYNFHSWGLATAQHYGLPSVGLDLTDNVLVALYFALHRFKVDRAAGTTVVRRAEPGDSPIIYGFGVFDYDVLDDEKVAPPFLQCARPRAQGSKYFCTAWGDASNKAADRLYVAIRLIGHHEWQSPLTTSDIFPPINQDAFLEFLLAVRRRYSDPRIEDLLIRVYFPP